MPKISDALIFAVLSVVAEIPKGTVASYGQIASLAGYEKNARLVGKILSISHRYGDYPCHRVVNAVGRCAPSFPEQKALLLAEDVTFQANGNVDMKKHRWHAGEYDYDHGGV